MEGMYERLAEGVEVPNPSGEPTNPPDPPKPPVDSDDAASVRAAREYLPLDHQKYQGIAEAKGYAQGEDFSGSRLQKVRYSHEAMIDVLIAEPTITQAELAKRFGRSQSWISIVMGSDAFQGALAKRRDDVMNPEIIASLEDRYRGLADQSLRVLAEKLEASRNPDLALKTLEISGKALGFGARAAGSVTNNATFVVALPPKSTSPEEWLKSANPQIESK